MKGLAGFVGFRSGSVMSNRPGSVRVGIRGDRVGMATKAALEPSQLENHITSLMRASFGRLKVTPLVEKSALLPEMLCDYVSSRDLTMAI